MTVSKDDFKKTRIVEVLDQYDGPIIYTFVNQLNDFYLAYFCEQEADLVTKKWLYVLTNQYSVDELKNDKVSISAFIERSKYILLSTTLKNEIQSIDEVEFNSIPDGFVPEADVFLESEEKDFVVKLNRKNINPSNVNGELIALVVSRISGGMKGVMKDVQVAFEDFKDSLLDPNLALTGIKAGSVELVFKPINKNPLLSKSLEVVGNVLSDNTTGMSPELVNSVKKQIINMAPTNRRGFNFDSIQFFYPNQEAKMNTFELTNDLRKEIKGTLPADADKEIVVVIKGMIKEYDKRDSSFVLCEIENNDTISVTSIKCVPAGSNYFEDQAEEICLELFANDKKAKIVGKFNSKDNKIFVQSVSEA